MKLDKAEVEKLAHLARLEFNEKEKEEMIEDMDNIIGFIEKIDNLDLEGVEPLVYMTEDENRPREDKVLYEVGRDKALSNAPDKDSDYFRVPKVVNRD
jgi:aspartyl-tRNA(Asn)/glutamyl-tRNA(Gln) amidotransferase subunit C